MSIPVPITKKELKELRSVLLEEKQVICLDHASFVKTTLVAMELLSRCKDVAQVVKGF